jgi:pimeloyl-ACP methyl ester carboxylesterase
MTPRTRRIPAADGLELQLYEWSAEGTPLLMLHGFGNDAHVWADFAPVVAPHYRALALDMRGHGDSDWDPERRYDHLSMARDVEAVCDALELKRVVLIGHSMGGRVAMRFAGRNPERMAGLVLVDTAPELDARGVTRIRSEAETAETSFASIGAFEELLAANYPVARVDTIRALARHWLRQRADGRYEPKLDPAFRSRGASGTEEARRWMQQEEGALWQALRDTPCPALVVRGAASDVLSAETADRMVDDALGDGRLAVVDRAGHSVMIDNPEGFAEAVATFVLGDA